MKDGGWVRLLGTKKLRPGRKPRPPGEPPPKPEKQFRRDMARRLLEALDKRLMLLETRMAPDAELGEAMQSAADAQSGPTIPRDFSSNSAPAGAAPRPGLSQLCTLVYLELTMRSERLSRRL